MNTLLGDSYVAVSTPTLGNDMIDMKSLHATMSSARLRDAWMVFKQSRDAAGEKGSVDIDDSAGRGANKE